MKSFNMVTLYMVTIRSNLVKVDVMYLRNILDRNLEKCDEYLHLNCYPIDVNLHTASKFIS